MSAPAARLPGREHIPDYPKGYVAVHVIQLIFSIILIGCSAFSLAALPSLGGIFIIISSLVSFAISIWLISARHCAPQAYNYWASIAFDVFLFIFYLVGFALSALEAVFWLGTIYGIVLAVMAVFGAFNWIMFIVALIVDAVVVARHRRAGLRNRPGLAIGANVDPQTKEPQYQMTPQAYPAQPASPFQHVDPNVQYYAPQPHAGHPPVAGQVPQYPSPAQQPHY